MKKLFRNTIAIMLAVIFACQASVTAFAASSKTEYVSDVILSYGKTDDEAKKWLTDNGYTVVDNNLNEGATDKNIFATEERSVYLGYKTTTDSSKAITDMKLMNMEGGYSIQDYQLLLQDQKDNIASFMDSFITALGEYRKNYKAGNKRAVSAYESLNMLKDDDTGMTMGDLLLNKIKEEYSEKDWNALSADEQKKHADMTTILLQGNSKAVLNIEQTLATATDINETLWIERCSGADCYDDMLDELVDKYGDVNKASDELDEKYGDTAELIAAAAISYQEWIKDYVDGVTLQDSSTEVNDYLENADDTDKLSWMSKASQYELLNAIKLSDDTSLLDLMMTEKPENDPTIFYPIAKALTDGQKACLEFLSASEFVAMGMNTGDATADANDSWNVDGEKGSASVYAGIDRSIYNEDVALTGDAYALQTSSEDKDYSDNWFTGNTSTLTMVLGIATAVSLVATVTSFIASSNFASSAVLAKDSLDKLYQEHGISFHGERMLKGFEDSSKADEYEATISSSKSWSKVFKVAGITLSVVTILLSIGTLVSKYKDIKDYYKVDYTTIPSWMVDEGKDKNNKSVYTYYKAVKCNRNESNFGTDQTKLMGDYGDINGDVGKQWVALYTTTDTEAGKPILANSFTVQYADNTIPNDSVALSLFDESVAQNLTNEKKGFTYADKKGGIYMFYEVQDTNAFTASSISTIGWVGIGVAGVAIIAGIAFAITKTKKKKEAK